ncbi:GntR family transcriptional regulator [Nonomuraea sp. NPDC050556]|uniref:GntR family transcriptional regulator n=1 Tax=Nonomuraea sp. NPDC050556 TaxID=3364369 RepID=UPI003791CFE9
MNKSDQAYQALEELITFQELAPGSLLSERALMERTGFGRTPVREALQRLARDRMVDIHPNRGVFVAEASVESQLRLLEVRRSLEELAVRLAVQRASPRQRAAMLALTERLERFAGDDAHAFGPLLKESHALIAEAAGNDFLSVAMAPLQGLSRRFWFANLRDRAADIRAGADCHQAILRAVHGEDEEGAAQASRQLNDYLVAFAHRTLR